MALARKSNYISPEHFLEIRRHSNDPMEYIDGEILAMADNSKAHSQIVSAIDRLVGSFLIDKPCETGVGLSVKAPVSFLIPDLVVYCNGGDFTKDDDLLLNPLVVFEVLSESTERCDHGQKWVKYQHIDSLRHYVMIWQSEPQVEYYTREAGGGWHYDLAKGIDAAIHLSHLDLTLALSDMYQRVSFAPEPTT